MRLLTLGLVGVLGGLLLTVGVVREYDINKYIQHKVSGVITDAEAQVIYSEVVKASGQSGLLPSTLTIKNSGTVNAYTTIYGVTIYRGLLVQLNKDELALILGHEVAHFLLGHVFLPAETQTKENIRVEEMQADKFGAFLAMRAGYNVCKGREFFTMMNSSYGDNMDQDHPDFAFRYSQLNISCGGW